jgi:glutamate 5-kinase
VSDGRDPAALRQATCARARRIVVKVGSRLIKESPAGRPAAIADELHALRGRVPDAVVVSSGAIALGIGGLGLASRPTALPLLQAAAALGQTRLMQSWEHAFGVHQRAVAQILLTHDDLADRRRFLNARHALRALLDRGAVPIVNENDTVAVDEIRWGDNDTLAALVCNLIGADLLVILTDVDGLHDAHPERGGRRVPLVVDIDLEAAPVAGGPTSGVGSGGMASKVQAARAAARHGVATCVVGGARPGALTAALSGADVGTLFVPSRERMSSRKHWIAYGARPTGRIVVDDGARRAIAELGRSLLPAGIVEVVGGFELGDIVSLMGPDGGEFARGLAGYPAGDLRRLKGLQSSDIEATLGYKVLDEVVHRDDLVLL